MRIVKTGDKKYPLMLTLSNGAVLKVPKQANFDNSFLRCHGCSLMAEYLALQYLHKHVYPLHLLQWHRKNDKDDIKAKVTLKGVTKGINNYKPHHAIYEANPNARKVKLALISGAVVILEQRNPIHSVFLFADNGVDYIISYGKVSKANITKIVHKATTNATYKGMVVIK